MEVKSISSIEEFRDIVSLFDNNPRRQMEVHISGSLFTDIKATYKALGKCKTQEVGGKIGVGAAILGLMTGGLGLIVAAPAFVASSAAVVLALREFQASDYADEVYRLHKYGLRLRQNSDNKIILRT